MIFHGSQNGEPIPFQSFGPFLGYENADNLELLGVGYHIYNQWLADFCSVEPERHVGLAHLPMWDIDAAVREAEWARAAGLRGVNFPAPKPHIAPYNSPEWEPFWSACEDLGLTFGNHGGAGQPERRRRAGFERGHGVGALRAEPRVADQPARVRRRVRTSSQAPARAHRAPRHVVVVHAQRARLDLPPELHRVRPRARGAGAEAAERVLPRAGLHRWELPRAVRGRGRGRAGLRVERDLGLRLPARRRHVPVPRQLGRRAADPCRDALHLRRHRPATPRP